MCETQGKKSDLVIVVLLIKFISLGCIMVTFRSETLLYKNTIQREVSDYQLIEEMFMNVKRNFFMEDDGATYNSCHLLEFIVEE